MATIRKIALALLLIIITTVSGILVVLSIRKNEKQESKKIEDPKEQKEPESVDPAEPAEPEPVPENTENTDETPINSGQAMMDQWCIDFAKSRQVTFDGSNDDDLVYRFDAGPDDPEKKHRCYRKHAISYTQRGKVCLSEDGKTLEECYGVYDGKSTDGVWSEWIGKIKGAITRKTGNEPEFD